MAKTTCDWPHRSPVTPEAERSLSGWKGRERRPALKLTDGAGNKLRLCEYHTNVVVGFVVQGLRKATSQAADEEAASA